MARAGTLLFIAIGVAAALTGCTSRKQLVAKCQLEADHLYRGETITSGDRVGAYITTRMRARGYEWNDKDAFCASIESVSFAPGVEACYRRSSGLLSN